MILKLFIFIASVHLVVLVVLTKSCPTLCDPMDCSTPGFPILHHLRELAQTHVHWVSDTVQPAQTHAYWVDDTIQLSCPLPLLLPSIFPGLLQWIISLRQVAKVLELQLQLQSFQLIFGVDSLQDWLVWSPCSPRDSQASSPAPQFEGINSSVLTLSYCPSLISIHDYWRKHSFDWMDLCWQINVSAF